VLRPILKVAWLFAVAILAAAAASGQTATVVNPTIVQFDPSADHSSLDSAGNPVVLRYDLYFYVVGSAAPYTTVNLGKPAIGPDGTIQVDFSALMAIWPLPDGTYDARVVAVGQNGTGQSDPSNTFTFQSSNPGGSAPTCSYTLSATAWSVGADGGTTTVTVTASSAACGWTAMGTSLWATVSPASGTGTGTVTVTAASNSTTARSAVLTIAGQTFTVTQNAPSCTFALAFSSSSVAAPGGASSVGLTASGSTCGWTASSGASWATVSPASGTGSGTVTVTVAANTGAARTAALTIAGQTYTVSQASATCSYALSATSLSVAAAGGAGTATVSANLPTCGWTASSGASWATVSPASGTGSGTVTVTVAANTGAARTAALTIAGQTYTVSQASATCSFTISPSSVSAGAVASSSTVTVKSNAPTCSWSASTTADWITFDSPTGTGSGTLKFSLLRNQTGLARTGSIVIAAKIVTVVQSPATAPSRPTGLRLRARR
jgi:hypothetical protein